MPRFLDTRGRSTLGIGICDRCSRKFSLDDLYSDPNSPGLRVCKDDLDQLDPWRLAPASPDAITLPFVRPDVSVVTTVDTVSQVPVDPQEGGPNQPLP